MSSMNQVRNLVLQYTMTIAIVCGLPRCLFVLNFCKSPLAAQMQIQIDASEGPSIVTVQEYDKHSDDSEPCGRRETMKR